MTFTAHLSGQQYTFTTCPECNGIGAQVRKFCGTAGNEYAKRYETHRLMCGVCGGTGMARTKTSVRERRK